MKSSQPGALRLFQQLQRARELQREVVDSDGLHPAQIKLKSWQMQRLGATYADFAVQPRFGPALEFFKTDLYGTGDFTQRDADLERVFPIMKRVLSDQVLLSLSLAVELHALSQQLDSQLIAVLRGQFDLDLAKASAQITQSNYADAFRHCKNYNERLHQIDLICQIGAMLDDVVHHPFVYITSRIARRPARAAGFGELQDFIDRGLAAFRKMKDATPFLEAIRLREVFILEQIYAGGELSSWGAESFSI